jgi:hypothetical protein
MTQPRKTLVCVEQTPYYHCIGRCVRRAFLCGHDAATGRSFEHRRSWMRERLALLSRVFAIDVCAYALMSNHYHLVLRLVPARTAHWSDDEVAERWGALFTGPPLVQRYLRGHLVSTAEQARARAVLNTWRQRLADLSWFMRCLNEYIARRANAEDACKGHFWEARFKSQALLDDIALLQGMVYVDLNPIRAALAGGIEDSDFTAVQQRFRALTGLASPVPEDPLPRLAALREPGTSDTDTLPFTLLDYLALVDATGRCCLAGKRGFIAADRPKLLQHLHLDPDRWLDRMRSPRGSAHHAVGAPDALRRFAARMVQQWIHGMSVARALYPT